MVIKSSKYESALGKDFLSWHDWAHTTLSPEELAIYEDGRDPDLPVTNAKDALHNRWIKEQKITCHIMYEDGVEVARTNHIVTK